MDISSAMKKTARLNIRTVPKNGKLKKETESLLISTQNNSVKSN